MRDDRQDLIEAYLGELRAELRTPDAELVLAEAEDHLRESAAAGLAIGMSEREAQEAAISAFGPVRAVARAHAFRGGRAGAGLMLAALRLGWTGMFAIAASGFVALAMNHLFGRSFVGGAPAGTRFAPAQCQHWLSIWHGAHSCAQAAILESSSDAVSLRVAVGGVGGLALLGVYLLALLYWRPGACCAPRAPDAERQAAPAAADAAVAASTGASQPAHSGFSPPRYTEGSVRAEGGCRHGVGGPCRRRLVRDGFRRAPEAQRRAVTAMADGRVRGLGAAQLRPANGRAA